MVAAVFLRVQLTSRFGCISERFCVIKLFLKNKKKYYFKTKSTANCGVIPKSIIQMIIMITV
jgi:hypothetical protein